MRSVRKGRPLAQKIQVLLIDDLDGSEAGGTVRSRPDGAEYEIDLNAERAQALRDACVVAIALHAGGPAGRGGAWEACPERAQSGAVNSTQVRE
jgi:hypothetical protein